MVAEPGRWRRRCYAVAMGRGTIGDLVTVRPRPTVVRLDDLKGERRGWIVEGYHLTPQVERFLVSVQAWLRGPAGGGGFLVGAYGSGKSHFLAYLAARLEAGELVEGEPPRVVPLSLVNYPARRSLEEIVTEAVGAPRGSADRRVAWQKVAADHPTGMILLLDELSEFLRSRPTPAAFNEDVRFLQFLGEWAQGSRLWILAGLQEEIEHTGRLESAVYRKIKDRYPLRLMLTPSHVRDLVADHLLERRPGFDEAVEEVVERLAAALPEGSVRLDALRRLYPIHPATLELLEEVRDIFSQTRGAVDLVVSRLLGDPARGIQPFLERPWGELLTPDVIVDHFLDLFEMQPELVPIAQRVLPHFRRRMEELFSAPRRRELAWRVLKLLILAHISPRREGLEPQEAAAWLALHATTVAPRRNVELVRRVLDGLAEDGAYVVEHGRRYRLELSEEGAQALKRLLPREVAELQGATPEAVWELLLGGLEGDAFLPVAVPAGRWRLHGVRWHFHERRVAVYVGGGRPPAPSVPLALCVRPPWAAEGPVPGVATVTAAPVELDPETLELAALLRLESRAGSAAVRNLVRRRIERGLPRLAERLRSAFLEAELVDAEGGRHPSPRPDIRQPFTRWLDQLALWVLRRRYPSFERVAPTAGPLPREAYRRFVELAEEHGLEAPSEDELVTVVREGYLVPMGLMQREGWYAVPQRRLDKNQLVQLLRPLLGGRISPSALAEHLQDSVFGLVPDQVNLLLVYLLLAGEIDILKGARSYREMYHAMPLPLAYDAVVPAQVLPAEQVKSLEELCSGLSVRPPRRWTALELGRILERLRARAREDRALLERLKTALAQDPDAAPVRERVEAYLSVWSVLEQEGAPAAAMERFLSAAGSVRRLLGERERLVGMADRLPALAEQRRRLLRLLSHPHLDPSWDPALAEGLRAVGEAPPLSDPRRVEEWVERAGAAYSAYAQAYGERHEAYWQEVAQHPVWTWTPPPVARSRHLGAGGALAELEQAREAAGRMRCRGLVDPELGPRCACGFDGSRAPIEEALQRFTAARRAVQRAVEGFFAQDRVREAVREWSRGGMEASDATIAYLEGRRRYPGIQDLELFDRHLAGASLVAEVTAEDLLEGVAGRPLEPGELAEAVARTIQSLPAQRVRVRLREAGEGVPEEVARWCLELALATGTPLPQAVSAVLPDAASGWVQPERVSAGALARLEELGLPRAVEDRVVRLVAEGAVAPPAGAAESPLVRAVVEFAVPTPVRNAAELALRSRTLYLAHPRMAPILGRAWLDHLDAVAGADLETPPEDLFAVLENERRAQWLVVDCLGLPLLEGLRPVLERALAAWRPGEAAFATVGRRTTTDGYWRGLAEGGLDHPMLKLNAVDRLLHQRELDLGELDRLAAAELEVSLARLVDRLDPLRPVTVFADHGFRLSRDGRGFEHGGPSTLERTVPVLRFDPRGSRRSDG